MMLCPNQRTTRRRGAAYFLVLGTSLMVSVIAVSGLVGQRIRARTCGDGSDLLEARYYARSAVEMGLLTIKSDSKWRKNVPNGTWTANIAIGEGQYSLAGVDPVDGDIKDPPGDPVILTGTGYKGRARHAVQVTVSPVKGPMEVLNACVYAGGNISVQWGKSVTLSGAPLSCGARTTNMGSIVGDLDTYQLSNWGTITGTAQTGVAAKELPDSGVFDAYAARATVIAHPGTILKQALGPGRNPWGAANAAGVYYISIGAADLTIKASRIEGTLVVLCGTGKVILDSAVFLHNFRSDYPVLIVKGTLRLNYDSANSSLSEATWLANYNPTGVAYQSVTDTDQTDTYPNEVQGLVHVIGNLEATSTSRVRGVVITEGTAQFGNNNEFIHDPAIVASPPDGYASWDMQEVSGSWTQAGG